jgi:hypothetical protein
MYSPLDPRLRAMKPCSITCFRREVKLKVPCHTFTACKKNLSVMIRDE